ncbi:MAG: pyruvate ferredoxin oxidoreductase, partial [Rubrivivax sp.]
CPSFVSVHGAQLKKKAGAAYTPQDLARELAAIEPPPAWAWTGPFDMLVTGVGGTGVVTIGALVTMAAHLESKQASVLDFMGFAQKGGAVLSFVRVAPTLDLLNQVRIDTQQADVLLACDMVVGASPDALGTVKAGRTVILANTHELPTASFVRDPDASMQADSLLAKMRFAVGDGELATVDAQDIARRLMGDTLPSNIVMLGACWQRGLVPVSEAALMRAIELNGVAIDANKTAFSLGRLAIAAPDALQRLAGEVNVVKLFNFDQLDGADGLIERRARFLIDYQNAAYAARYRALVERVRQAETALGKGQRLTQAVARYYAKLLAIKDEYEVARLYTDGRFEAAMKAQFDDWERLSFHLAPPLLARPGADGRAKKVELGSWTFTAFKWLARLKGLRGTALDIVGKTEERRMERQLIRDYEALIDEVLASLTADNLHIAVDLARLPEKIRGYGHVKQANVVAVKKQWQTLLDRFHGRAADIVPQPVAMPVRAKGVAEL